MYYFPFYIILYTLRIVNRLKLKYAGIRIWGAYFIRILGHKIKGANSCKFKNMINKTKKISYLIFKYSFNFWDCFLIIIFLAKIKMEKNNIILNKNILIPKKLKLIKIVN